MKAKVIRPFTDKYTMKPFEVGEVIKISKERFSELTAGPRGIFVEEISEGTKAPSNKSGSDSPPSDEVPDETEKDEPPEKEE